MVKEKKCYSILRWRKDLTGFLVCCFDSHTMGLKYNKLLPLHDAYYELSPQA